VVEIRLQGVDGCHRNLRDVWAVLFDPQLSSIDAAQPVRKTHDDALAPAALFVNPFPSVTDGAADRGLLPPGPRRTSYEMSMLWQAPGQPSALKR